MVNDSCLSLYALIVYFWVLFKALYGFHSGVICIGYEIINSQILSSETRVSSLAKRLCRISYASIMIHSILPLIPSPAQHFSFSQVSRLGKSDVTSRGFGMWIWSKNRTKNINPWCRFRMTVLSLCNTRYSRGAKCSFPRRRRHWQEEGAGRSRSGERKSTYVSTLSGLFNG